MKGIVDFSLQIEKKKKDLINIFESKGSLLNKEVIDKSQELDLLIVRFLRLKTETGAIK